MFRIGVDLGGTKIEAIALADDGNIPVRLRVATPRHDYRATLSAIASLVREIEAVIGQQATVGIGMPGAISPATGLVKNANSTWLNGQPLAEDLSALLERPLRFANDANCFALSEASDGAAAGASCVFGVIIGTGTGGGVVVNGQVLTGVNAIGGEWGHNPLPAPLPEELPGPACYCGRFGCIETFLSGPGLARDHERATGLALEPAEISRRADAGESDAMATLERYEDRMARALASIINVIDPEAIVLGGGMSNIARLYENVPARWSRYVFSDRVDTRLVPPRHGDSSGVRGAAWLWPASALRATAG
jgi:fructokinase